MTSSLIKIMLTYSKNVIFLRHCKETNYFTNFFPQRCQNYVKAKNVTIKYKRYNKVQRGKENQWT